MVVKRLRIGHVTATFPPYYAGTGLVCYYNARELVRRGHEVHVYTASSPGSLGEEELEGAWVHRLNPLFQLGNAPFLHGLIDLRGLNLIHLHHPFIFGSEIVLIVKALRGIPFVLTHHNDLIGDGHRRWLFISYSSLFTPRVFGGAAKLMPVSQDYANNGEMKRLFHKNQVKVAEVPNGVDTDAFRPLPKDRKILETLNISKEAPVVLFVAVLDRAHHFKGLSYLLDAITSPALSDICLLVIGEGDLRSVYEARAVELNIRNRVCFAGTIPHRELPRYIAASDFLVLPSTPPESFGMVLIEALACGKPVIASNLPGVRTIVDDGVDGFLASPGNIADLAQKIYEMLSLPEERRKAMGDAGRRKVLDRYTWEKAAEKLEEIYFEVLQVS